MHSSHSNISVHPICKTLTVVITEITKDICTTLYIFRSETIHLVLLLLVLLDGATSSKKPKALLFQIRLG